MKWTQMPTSPRHPSAVQKQRPSPVHMAERRSTEIVPQGCPEKLYEDQAGLCSRCSSIDTEHLFFDPSKEEKRKILDLGKLGAEAEMSPCRLCRLFHAVKIREEEDDDDDDDDDDYFLYAMLAPNPNCSAIGTVLVVVRQSSTLWTEAFSLLRPRREFIAACTASETSSRGESLRARFINAKSIDFSIVRGWLQHCQVEHKEQCTANQASMSRLTGLKLIDCEQRRVVPASSCDQYSALSYVWGEKTSRTDRLTAESELAENLPQTIEDALKVTQMLGLRYVWIDRYCINQDDDSEVHTQIRQMHLIYQNATITLIGAAGTDPSFGLPGVSTTSRTSQPNAQLGGLGLVSTRSEPRSQIQTSTWNERAWTYQESFFSHRCLVFTEQQVYFECRSGIARETVDDFQESRYLQIFKPSLWTPDNPWNICSHLEAYCGRALSVESDAVRAFEGVFRSFDEHEVPIHHYYGVPILPPVTMGNVDLKPTQRSRAEAFAAGLCWANLTQGTRRLSFPSWSWAGWTVPIYYNEVFLLYPRTLKPEEDRRLKIFVENDDASLSDLDDINYHLPDQIGLDPVPRVIHIEAWTVPIKVQHMPAGADEWMAEFHSRTRHARDCNVSGLFAEFLEEGYSLQVPLYLLSQQHGDDITTQRRLMSASGGDNILGIILNRREDILELAFHGDVFVLLVQKKGQYYERIGHMTFKCGLLSFTSATASWQKFVDIGARAADLDVMLQSFVKLQEWRKIPLV